MPTYVGNLFADAQGRYPAALNEWERTVIETEQARDSFVAWTATPPDPPPPQPASRMDDRERWTSVHVDFVIVSRRDDGSLGTSLLDPHGDQFADARAKLLALSDYAERFGDDFVRIEWLAVANGVLRSLNLLDPSVRDASRAFDGAKVTVLSESDRATDYQ